MLQSSPDRRAINYSRFARALLLIRSNILKSQVEMPLVLVSPEDPVSLYVPYLVIGYWILDVGYWLLDIGYWLLDRITSEQHNLSSPAFSPLAHNLSDPLVSALRVHR